WSRAPSPPPGGRLPPRLRLTMRRTGVWDPGRARSRSSSLQCRIVAVTKAIDIRTEIPGPRSRELLARELEAVAHPLIVHLPVFAAEAEGCTITDVDGNRFIDFAGGVGVITV